LKYFISIRRCIWISLAFGSGSFGARSTEPLHLKSSVLLPELPSAEHKKQAPVFVIGDAITVADRKDVLITGRAEIRRPDMVIHADTLHFSDTTKQAMASGQVRINQLGNIFTGPLLSFNTETYVGYFLDPNYRFFRNDTHGHASRIDFLGKTKSVVYDATYTSCNCEHPSWLLKAKNITFDTDKDEGVARDAVLQFKDVPILASPWLSFPLSNARRSGFLPPTFGFDSTSGAEYAQPYYWNIAPNQDATLTPTYMNARGVNFRSQYRYLQNQSQGIFDVDYMNADKLRKQDRWRVRAKEQLSYPTNLGNLSALINVNRVSDNNYWQDFQNSDSAWSAQSSRLLPSDVTLNWQMEALNTYVTVQKWQTLQDPASPIAPPFDRAPQIGMNYAKTLPGQLNWYISADMTHFVANSPLVTLPNAKRAMMATQLSRTWRNSYSYVTPKVQLHAVNYTYDKPWLKGARSNNSSVPTMSLDSGLYFDRHFTWHSNAYTQTLEPRALYVYTPYVDQSMLPNYDTANQDFSFATIFSDNTFVGQDKIADSNLLTAGAISRFWSDASGEELARFGVAQRLRFSPRKVTLDASDHGVPTGMSDLLLGGIVHIMPNWDLESTMQYDLKTNLSKRAIVRASYHPGSYQVLNASYLFQRHNNTQLGFSWQWPITKFWSSHKSKISDDLEKNTGHYYGIGQVHYGVENRRWIDTLVGIEYDAGCWIGRVLVQSQQTSVQAATRSLMFQIEFVGFARLGIGSRTALSDRIDRYQSLSPNSNDNSRYSNYD
jgi:LPS-assembly protein